MISEVMSLLEKEKAVYANLKKKKDSILTDSIAKINKTKKANKKKMGISEDFEKKITSYRKKLN
jgi:hypothetical protein